MLIHTRRVGEILLSSNDIDVTPIEVRGKQARMGVKAHDDVNIVLKEIFKKNRLKSSLSKLVIALAAFTLFLGSAAAQEFIDFENLPPDAPVFDQFPGVRFPGIGHIVTPAISTASGVQALTSLEPSGEFDSAPLLIEFNTPQQFVRLKVGVEASSGTPVQATLRAFDENGNLVDEVGPIGLPAPSPITTEMSIEATTAVISRVELRYTRAFAETIDDLEFNTAAPGPVDAEAPIVEIIQPLDNAVLTGEQYIINAVVTENSLLAFGEVTRFHEPSNTTTTSPVSFSGTSPNFHFGPLFYGPLGMGQNIITVSATDFAGNSSSDVVTVERIDIDGELQIDQEVITIPRLPGSVEPLTVHLEETFPGSLDGRENIVITIINSEGITGFSRIRDRLNDPVPTTELILHANRYTPLGAQTITLEARDEASSRVLDTATVLANVVPSSPVQCSTDVPAYIAIDRDEFSAQITEGLQRSLRGDGSIVFGGDDDNPADHDVGQALDNFPNQASFVDQVTNADSDGNDTLDVGEAMYMDNDGSAIVSEGDERLKNSVTGVNGSIVGNNAGDIGTALTALPDTVRYLDVSGDGILNGAQKETIVVDNDNNSIISAGDLRIVDSFVMAPISLIDSLTVDYLNDLYGDGELRVNARFLGSFLGFFGGEFQFIGDLRIVFRGLLGVDFNYTYTHVNASGTETNIPVLGGFVENAAENQFRAAFLDRFRTDLGMNITQRIEDENALIFFRTAYINPNEFALGFCFPIDIFLREFGE